MVCAAFFIYRTVVEVIIRAKEFGAYTSKQLQKKRSFSKIRPSLFNITWSSTPSGHCAFLWNIDTTVSVPQLKEYLNQLICIYGVN
jgi:hypothetical protein